MANDYKLDAGLSTAYKALPTHARQNLHLQLGGLKLSLTLQTHQLNFQSSFTLKACSHICTEQTSAWSKHYLIFHKNLIKMNGNIIFPAVQHLLKRDYCRLSLASVQILLKFRYHTEVSITPSVSYRQHFTTICRWTEVANWIMHFCHYETLLEDIIFLLLSREGFSHDHRITDESRNKPVLFLEGPKSLFRCISLRSDMTAGPQAACSATLHICPKPTFASISAVGIHLKWSLMTVVTQVLQHQKAGSLTIEHTEPLNHSQAQRLIFHDWHYLEWALLKECCCFLYFSYQNAYFPNSITERVKSSFKVKRFKTKSYYLLYFKAF